MERTLALGLVAACLAAGCSGDGGPVTTGAAPPAAAEWIAFHSDPDGVDDLFAVTADGSETRRLTDGLEQIAGAPWSPDGSRLAFLARPSGVDDVYVVNADGTGLQQLTESDGSHYALSWSPDGERLLYETEAGIYAMNADGSGRELLAESAGQPVWSPDGSRIAYISLAEASPDIYTMNHDGTGRRRLTSDPAEDVDPAWSPDGERIAFTSTRTGSHQIWVMDADGGAQRRLVSDQWSDQQPFWSPDGTRIVFTSYRNADPLQRGVGDADIVVASADGESVENLSRSPAWEGDPAWSPDGTMIAFAIRDDFGETGTFRLGVMTASGQDPVFFERVRDSAGLPANACCPSWQPGAPTSD